MTQGPEAAVPAHEPVLAECPFDGRDPPDQQDRDEHEVGADHPGEPPERGSEAAGRDEIVHGRDGHDERDAHRRSGPGQEGEQPRPRAPRLGAGVAAGVG